MNGKFVAALIPLVLALAGCSSGPTPAEARTSAAAVKAAMQVKIHYEAEGEPLPDKGAYANVTMQTPTGSSQSSPDLPLRTEDGVYGLVLTFTAGAFVYLSVQNNGTTSGVTCRIKSDSGQIISENTSDAQYGIASCRGRAQ